jgi:hypothetical protein
LPELEKIFEELLANPETKILVFSEWTRMLELVEQICRRLGAGYALHTGSVPQQRRRGEIRRFKETPSCRVFLSSDSGSTGLNLQNASVVINCDLPWNPARLEQRIARAWRKNQLLPVTVIHLVAENTIEHQMLGTLASKQALADGVLDRIGDLDSIRFRGGRQAMLARLEQLMVPLSTPPPQPPSPQYPPDRAKAFAEKVKGLLGDSLCHCEERYPERGDYSVLYVVVERESGQWRPRLEEEFQALFNTPEVPAPPARLEVIDRQTAEALERLSQSGLIQVSHRAIRQLLLSGEPEGPATSLSNEERKKAEEFRAAAARKWKMARLLAGGELAEEARTAALEALLSQARALAVENHLPEPAENHHLSVPPWSFAWKEHLEAVKNFLGNEQSEVTLLAGIWPAP